MPPLSQGSLPLCRLTEHPLAPRPLNPSYQDGLQLSGRRSALSQLQLPHYSSIPRRCSCTFWTSVVYFRIRQAATPFSYISSISPGLRCEGSGTKKTTITVQTTPVAKNSQAVLYPQFAPFVSTIECKLGFLGGRVGHRDRIGAGLRMTGRAVLKVKPNKTDIPAANPAVLARSFWDDTSPTKAQPRLPTMRRVSMHAACQRLRAGLTGAAKERPDTGHEYQKVEERSRLLHEAEDANH